MFSPSADSIAPASTFSASPVTDSGSCSASQASGKRVAHSWTDEETKFFLDLMRGSEDEPGFHARIKRKKLHRTAAMEEIASLLRAKGFGITRQQVDNKWKSLLASYRATEDHNSQSGNDYQKEGPWHEEMADIMGDRASTRPRVLLGSSLSPPLDTTLVYPDPDPTSPGACGSSPSSMLSTLAPAPYRLHGSPRTPSSSSPASSARSGDLEITPVRRSHARPFLVEDDSDDAMEGPVTPKAKRPKLAKASRSRTSEVLEWAKGYEATIKKVEEDRTEMLERHREEQREERAQQHADKMNLLSRLVGVLERRVEGNQ